jgi:hypothetical protein
MTRRVRVTAIYNQEPEVRLYVLALIALARQLRQEEQAARIRIAEVGSAQSGDSTDA